MAAFPLEGLKPFYRAVLAAQADRLNGRIPA